MKAKATGKAPTLQQIMESYRTMSQSELKKAFQEWKVQVIAELGQVGCGIDG